MRTTKNARLGFILGIQNRSGTNYLYRLVQEHPDCDNPEPIYEDHFVQYSYLLHLYATKLYEAWRPDWEVESEIAPKASLMRHLGDAIGLFLHGHSSLQSDDGTVSEAKLLLTKTPSVDGMEHFFDLFPDAYLIVIVRDGRALVESGVRSFDWDYEEAARWWNKGAEQILNLQARHADSGARLLLVRYEDLFRNEEAELRRILEFLDLDPEEYDFASSRSLGVVGSSESREESGEVHWRATDKTTDFNPLERFSNWDKKRHGRFNWIAGENMERLGYSLLKVPRAASKNRVLDLRRKALRYLGRSRVASYLGRSN